MIRKELRLPLLALVLLSLGGWLLHARIHPIVTVDPAHPAAARNFVPYLSGLVSLLVTPMLLNWRRTFVVGYLINGMGVVIGAIGMASLSFAKPPAPLTFVSLFTGTMLPDILILFPKLFLGQIVLRYWHPQGMGRLFTTWFWTRHFVYLTAVFVIGCLLWR